MQRLDGTLLHSASDLVAFLGCEHRTVLDRAHLDVSAETSAHDEHARLLQKKGHEHERAYLEHLRSVHREVVVIDSVPGASRAEDLAARTARTLAAMRRGADVVHQATFVDGGLIGHADFLRRVDGASALGGWHYEVIDTKLARSPKASHVVQLAFYARLLERAQGRAPDHAFVVTGQGQEAEVVIVSMTTSSEEYLPRDKAFLYSRNRLNVAASRGRCLAVVVRSPGLMEARCGTVEEVSLVNVLCGMAASGWGRSWRGRPRRRNGPSLDDRWCGGCQEVCV